MDKTTTDSKLANITSGMARMENSNTASLVEPMLRPPSYVVNGVPSYDNTGGFVGERITPNDLQGGYKADEGKPRFGLIPPKFLRALAELFTAGAKKYSDWNWYLGMNYSRVYDAMMRHQNAWWDGEKYDPIDGQHHLISAAWCACVLFIYDMTPDKFNKFDDRLTMLKDEDIRASINTSAVK